METRVVDEPWKPSLDDVYMKTRRANFHLKSAEKQLSNWINSNPYTIVEKDNPELTKHAFKITPRPAPEDIALTVGDFVNCLRSALDQLAWNLVHLFPHTIPLDEKAARRISFPICESDAAYIGKLKLFDSSIHPVMNSLQPDDRGKAIETHALWKLEKLWNLDKHRTIPINSGNWLIKLPGGRIGEIGQKTAGLNYYFYVIVPCESRFCYRPAYVKPQVFVDILFGEYMGAFAVTMRQLREIYDFVTRDVIPKFASFFPSRPLS